MGTDEQAPLDPEVLTDPLDGEEKTEPKPAGRRAAALVPVGDRSLVPADPFRKYLAEIRKYPPLNREEEQRLARRYHATGDREALFRLITANLMLVVRIALSFRRAARNLLDLIQEGNIGLLQAIERFNPEVGARLPTYAAWWVRAYMVKYLLDNVRLVRVGTTNARRRLLRNLRREKARLEEQGFEVGPRLLAERFGVSERDVRDVEQAMDSRDVSLDAPIGEEGTRSGADLLASPAPSAEEEVARRELQERADAALARFRKGLGEKDRAILDLRILSDNPLTLQQIGDRFQVTREAVRQSEARLKKRLEEHLRRELGGVADVRVRKR